MPTVSLAALVAVLALRNTLPSARDSVPLFTDLGRYHVAIRTQVPLAQRYFDQGMRLVYAFNHAEAIRAFQEAARRDPNCAMCRWGAALAYGPHVNAPRMDSAASQAAWQELQQAVSLAPRATPRERAYIRALSARYAPTYRADRAPLDSAYARAMGDLVAQYPNDLDAATLYAEALMDLSPWHYWTKSGAPAPGTATIISELERVVRAAPDHPGACHYYIHAVEAVAPQKAVPCAERLAALMPGAGHMVHMPAHIYIRVGRYADAIRANVHAVHTDEQYIASERPEGVYPLGYYPHNYHFLAFAAAMAGESAQAIAAARKLSTTVKPEVARMVPPLEPHLAYYQLTLLTFGRWDEALAAPSPPADLRVAAGLAAYARGVAYAAKGRWAEAQQMADTVRQITADLTPRAQTAMSTGKGENETTMQIAMHALLGEIAQRRGQLDEAIGHFREAARLEDTFNYTEPPQWYFPVRHALGAALLAAGRPAEAEAVYREDLQRFPENGWALHGLALALRARGATTEATQVESRFARAWKDADVTLTAPRL